MCACACLCLCADLCALLGVCAVHECVCVLVCAYVCVQCVRACSFLQHSLHDFNLSICCFKECFIGCLFQEDVNTVCFADESGHLIYSGGDDSLCKVSLFHCPLCRSYCIHIHFSNGLNYQQSEYRVLVLFWEALYILQTSFNTMC